MSKNGKRAHNFIDLTGQRFGMLTAIEPMEKVKGAGNVIWRCKCDCGGETTATAQVLRYGYKWNCGCTNVYKERRAGRMVKRVIQKPETVKEALCWGCVRSAAVAGVQCCWTESAGKNLVAGCEYISKKTSNGEVLRMIVECPEYLSEEVEANRQILREAREKISVERYNELIDAMAFGHSGALKIQRH